MSVSYPQKMRQRAKSSKNVLATVSVLGVTFQGPCTRVEAEKLLELFNEWQSKRLQRINERRA